MGRIFGLPPDDLETIRRANSHLQKLFPLFHMAISLWLSAPAASDLHTLLHQNDGSVAACGDNRWGQCNEQRSEQTEAVIFASGLVAMVCAGPLVFMGISTLPKSVGTRHDLGTRHEQVFQNTACTESALTC